MERMGSAAVEMAVVAPLFFLMLMGMIEFGRLVMVQQVLTNAAREGARVGILDNRTAADVQSASNQFLSAAGVSGATVNVTPDPPSSAPAGSPVTVTITVPFSQVSWLPSPIFIHNLNLTANATMRRETVQ
ncbi:MAG: pilus assembly protein [Planctomycetota bacterium]|nr:MAG: pilus assembly protein [Planctomycetota bacterium]